MQLLKKEAQAQRPKHSRCGTEYEVSFGIMSTLLRWETLLTTAILSCTHSSIHSPSIQQSIHSSTRLPTHFSIHQPTYPIVHLPILLSSSSPNQPSIPLSSPPLLLPSLHSSNHWSNPFTHPSIHPFTHPSIHWSNPAIHPSERPSLYLFLFPSAHLYAFTHHVLNTNSGGDGDSWVEKKNKHQFCSYFKSYLLPEYSLILAEF